MLALDTDTDHPHVHLTVATEGMEGSRFNPRKADLHHMRETFARELRAQAFLRASNEECRAEDVMALPRQKHIRGAYAEAAVALAGTGKTEDIALSGEIARFLAEMPPTVSRRLGRACEILQSGRVQIEPAHTAREIVPPEGGPEALHRARPDRERQVPVTRAPPVKKYPDRDIYMYPRMRLAHNIPNGAIVA